MMRTTNDDRAVPRHLDDADLISYLDGELDREDHEYARSHLEGCWNCRSELLAVQNSIENFLRARKQIIPTDIPPSGVAVAQFRRRLAEHRSAPVGMRLQISDWLISLSVLPFIGVIQKYRKTALVSALAGLALILIFADPLKWSVVSADDLLNRASTYEFLNETPSRKVIRTRGRLDLINLKTRDQKTLAQIETDADNLSSAIHLSAETTGGGVQKQTLSDRGKSSNLELLAQDFGFDTARYLSEQGWLPQVSVSLYKRLIAGRGLNDSDGASAKRSGAVYEIEHTFAPSHSSHIFKTELTLNANTYAPQTLSIFTIRGEEQFEYRLTRTSIESIDRTPDVARLFEVSPNQNNLNSTANAKIETPNLKPETKTPETRGSALETEASADLEVEVLRLLHQAGADLGEQINVTRDAGGPVRVSGIVDSDRRKGEILQALQSVSNNPAVHIEVKTVAEAMAERRKQRDASSSTAIEGVEVAADTFPVYHDLRGRMSDEEARVFAARMVSRSHNAMRHAWALKRLMGQFTAKDLATLQPEAHAKWIALVQNHARSFERESSSLREQLQPFFSSGSQPATAAGEIKNDADLIRAVERLVVLAASNYEVVRSAFTVTRETSAVSAIKTPQFWQSLRSAEALAARIAQSN